MSIPKWFISRGAGVYTALIPADELPLSVNLQGVPSTMTVDQVGGMTFIAETGPTIQRFVLDRQSPFPGQAFSDVSTASPSPIAPPLKQFCAPDAQVGGITSHQSQFNTGTEMIPKVEEAQAIIDSICRPESAAAVCVEGYWPPQRHLPPSGNEPDETKKVYCSYWMHHGSCDYTQQGCKYKHEMPTDIHTLRKLGFRGIPKWYLEEQAVKRSRQTGMGSISDVRASSSITGPMARANQALASSASKGKASVPEEPNVKRSRFAEDEATVPRSATTRGVPRSTAVVKHSPPGLPSPKMEPELTPPTRVASKFASTSATAKAAPPPPPAKPIKDSLNLIDLSDDDDAPTIRAMPCSPTSTPSTSLPSSPLALSSGSSSDSDATSDPRTPPTAVLVDSPVSESEKAIFIPSGESPLSHRRRFHSKQPRCSKRTGPRSSPKLGLPGARTSKLTAAAGSYAPRSDAASDVCAARTSVGVLGGGKATGLNASRYAVLDHDAERSRSSAPSPAKVAVGTGR
ncbi:hypothetical protein BDV97DRAFT_395208 [Delphinella strobiligena]|nr:hypothetical protein BDV97DRAFT_395208 [Delphinella strobiligena]